MKVTTPESTRMINPEMLEHAFETTRKEEEGRNRAATTRLTGDPVKVLVGGLLLVVVRPGVRNPRIGMAERITG